MSLYREDGSISMTSVLAWTLFGTFLLILVLSIFGAFNPFFLDQQRTSIEHSQNYLDAQTTAINGFIHEYNNLEVQRQQAIAAGNSEESTLVQSYVTLQNSSVNQICASYNGVQDDVRSEFPQPIQDFVRQHPCS